jgi:hypothetical protein
MDVIERVSLQDQIAEVRREVAMRQKVYVRLVYFGKMTDEEAATRAQNMAAVLRTLETLRDQTREGAASGVESLAAPPV